MLAWRWWTSRYDPHWASARSALLLVLHTLAPSSEAWEEKSTRWTVDHRCRERETAVLYLIGAKTRRLGFFRRLGDTFALDEGVQDCWPRRLWTGFAGFFLVGVGVHLPTETRRCWETDDETPESLFLFSIPGIQILWHKLVLSELITRGLWVEPVRPLEECQIFYMQIFPRLPRGFRQPHY